MVYKTLTFVILLLITVACSLSDKRVTRTDYSLINPFTHKFTSIQEVNEYVNYLPYVSDIDNYGKSDYWASFSEFIAHNGGDCEDQAVAKMYLLIRDNIVKVEDITFLIVYLPEKDAHHAVLIIHDMVLDNDVDAYITPISQVIPSLYTPKLAVPNVFLDTLFK